MPRDSLFFASSINASFFRCLLVQSLANNPPVYFILFRTLPYLWSFFRDLNTWSIYNPTRVTCGVISFIAAVHATDTRHWLDRWVTLWSWLCYVHVHVRRGEDSVRLVLHPIHTPGSPSCTTLSCLCHFYPVTWHIAKSTNQHDRQSVGHHHLASWQLYQDGCIKICVICITNENSRLMIKARRYYVFPRASIF